MNATIYNNTFLNSLFTAEEFKFIKSIDSDSQKYDSTLKKEIKYRDGVVTFINALREKMVKGETFEESENLSNLLKASQECFDKVNENIKSIQNIKETSDSINSKIVELLINAESQEDTISASKFHDEASSLKDSIISFTDTLDSTNSKIESNDVLIEDFLSQSTVKKYLPTDYNWDITSEDSTEDSSSSVSSDLLGNIEIPENIKENNTTLLVSEKEKKVFLPYTKTEILEYIKQYPKQYKSFEDVVYQEFIFPIDFYVKHPAIARFRETYSLIRDRESKTIIDAFKFAMDTMFQHDLNPAVIAACKSQEQLEHYIQCLENKDLDKFLDFKIQFEVNPLKV